MQAFIDELDKRAAYFLQNVDLPTPLQEACLYAFEAGGKRLRPQLSYGAFLAVAEPCPQSSQSMLLRSAMAVELIHTYSLIHDDLPCMDDDALRRGKPTCHKVFGEEVALLSGDVLQSLAFECLSSELLGDFDPVIYARLTPILARASRRMVAGQMRDVLGEHQHLTQNELMAIHKDKTGALIEAACVMGAICGGAIDVSAIAQFAQDLGLGYQVQDDVLDVVGDSAVLGKSVGSDAKLDKSTYVKLLGVSQAMQYAQELFDRATQQIINLPNANPLIQITERIKNRDK